MPLNNPNVESEMNPYRLYLSHDDHQDLKKRKSETIPIRGNRRPFCWWRDYGSKLRDKSTVDVRAFIERAFAGKAILQAHVPLIINDRSTVA